MAAMLLPERLIPLERAVFVLREVFGFGFPGSRRRWGARRRRAASSRRGRGRHVDAGRPRFEADRREREKLVARFFGALQEGDV